MGKLRNVKSKLGAVTAKQWFFGLVLIASYLFTVYIQNLVHPWYGVADFVELAFRDGTIVAEYFGFVLGWMGLVYLIVGAANKISRWKRGASIPVDTYLIIYFFVWVGVGNLLYTSSRFEAKRDPIELSVYSFQNKFEAAFPIRPQLNVQARFEDINYRGATYTDEENILFYAAGYSNRRYSAKLTESSIPVAIDAFINGQARSIGGRIVNKDIGMIGGERGAYFTIRYEVQGNTLMKYAAVIFHGGQFFQWSVQDAPLMSTRSALDIFNRHVKYFRVK